MATGHATAIATQMAAEGWRRTSADARRPPSTAPARHATSAITTACTGSMETGSPVASVANAAIDMAASGTDATPSSTARSTRPPYVPIQDVAGELGLGTRAAGD